MKFILAILYIAYFDHPYFLLSSFKWTNRLSLVFSVTFVKKFPRSKHENTQPYLLSHNKSLTFIIAMMLCLLLEVAGN